MAQKRNMNGTMSFHNFRSDSPPIPTMRNKNSNIPGGDGVGDGHAEVVEQLSTMRKELDRKAEEHDAVWNGLVEV